MPRDDLEKLTGPVFHRTIEIEHKPYVKGPAQSRIVKYVGQELTVMCSVDALPAPVMSMGRIGGYLTSEDDRIKMITQSPSVFIK